MNDTKVEDFDISLRQTLKESLESMDLLLTQINKDKAVISEDVFKRKLLPVLLKDGDGTLGVWQDIAGIVTRPILVVNNAREILFEIPPPLRNVDETMDVKVEGGVNAVIQRANLMGRSIPKMGQREIEERLGSKVPNVKVNQSVLDTWFKILESYRTKGKLDATSIDLPKLTNSTTKKEAPVVSEGYTDLW